VKVLISEVLRLEMLGMMIGALTSVTMVYG